MLLLNHLLFKPCKATELPLPADAIPREPDEAPRLSQPTLHPGVNSRHIAVLGHSYSELLQDLCSVAFPAGLDTCISEDLVTAQIDICYFQYKTMENTDPFPLVPYLWQCPGWSLSDELSFAHFEISISQTSEFYLKLVAHRRAVFPLLRRRGGIFLSFVSHAARLSVSVWAVNRGFSPRALREHPLVCCAQSSDDENPEFLLITASTETKSPQITAF